MSKFIDWWLKLIFWRSYKACDKLAEELDNLSKLQTVVEKEPVKQISEPVLSIIETMKEEGRWIVTKEKEDWLNCIATDTKTGIVFRVYYCMYTPATCYIKGLGWMTNDENNIIVEAIRKLKQKQYEDNKQQERQKMMGIYCKEVVQ